MTVFSANDLLATSTVHWHPIAKYFIFLFYVRIRLIRSVYIKCLIEISNNPFASYEVSGIHNHQVWTSPKGGFLLCFYLMRSNNTSSSLRGLLHLTTWGTKNMMSILVSVTSHRGKFDVAFGFVYCEHSFTFSGRSIDTRKHNMKDDSIAPCLRSCLFPK